MSRATLQDYTIKSASKEQERQHALAGYDHWQKGEPFEEYHKVCVRERQESKWGKDALVTWVLVRKDDPEGEIYSGCETYRRQGLIKRQGASDIERGYVYCIASVVTPKSHGRKGYATRLLSLLHRHLSPASALPVPAAGGLDAPLPLPPKVKEQVPKAIGSYLWSDVGSHFYAKCAMGEGREGWVVDDTQCSQLVWKILPPATTSTVTGGWSWIHLRDLEGIAPLLSSRLQSALRTTDTSQHSVFNTDPASPGVLDFVPVKGSWKRPTSEPLPVGIRIPSPEGEEEDAIVLFAVSCIHISERFLITHISNLSPAQLPLLLEAVDSLAASSGLGPTEGWVWDLGLSGGLVDAWKKQDGREVQVGRREEIGGHLLAVAWYGEEEGGGKMGNGEIWNWA
ncbi:hypothetical protein IAR50_004418 [Cryptococcus sp. DSM 104548]